MKTPRHSASVLEQLEPRLAPAGLINVVVSSAGNLVLSTVAGQDGDEVVTMDRLNDGSYQLSPGAGVTLRIGGSDFTTPQVLFGVTGGLLANLGAGNDTIALSGCFFNKAVVVNLGAGNDVFTMTDSSLAGSLLVTTGDGSDSVNFTGADCAVAGPATFKLGAGNDLIAGTVDRLGFGAGVLVDGGAGTDSVVLAATDGDDVRVLGNVKFVGGSGEDALGIGTANATFSATGAVMMTDAGGNDGVFLAGTRFDAAALILQLGPGSNSVTSSAGQLTLARNLQVTAGSGADVVSLFGTALRVGANLDVNLGSGGGSAFFNPSSSLYVGGTARLAVSAAEGLSRSVIMATQDIMVGGKLTATGGAGNGNVSLFGNVSVYLGGGAALFTGAGNSSLDITTNGSLVSNGSIALSHGGGDGLLKIFSSSAGDSAINGSVTIIGGDAIDITMAGLITGRVNLATSLTPADAPVIAMKSNGGDGLTCAAAVNVKVTSLVAGTGAINVGNAILQSAATFLGGAGADTIRLDQINAAHVVTVNLGAGADVFRLERDGIGGGSIYLSPVLLIGGSGSDDFQIGGDSAGVNNIDFRNAVTADGGTEADTLAIGTQVTFAAGFPLKQVNIP